jgi:hypothetical protein
LNRPGKLLLGLVQLELEQMGGEEEEEEED